MSEVEVRAVRPDVDIAVDIHEILVHYPPLALDRHHVQVKVQSGVATLSGHVKTPMSRRYLVERAAQVPDVTQVQADALFTEEGIRLAAGPVVPEGVIVNVRYGVVILTTVAALPADVSMEAVTAKVQAIPGVEQVIVGAQK